MHTYLPTKLKKTFAVQIAELQVFFGKKRAKMALVNLR